MRSNGLTQVPAKTSRVARAVFPKGCLAMRAHDALGALLGDEQFSELFAARGVQRGHRRGWRWCWELVEGLTDRQAADAVRARL